MTASLALADTVPLPDATAEQLLRCARDKRDYANEVELSATRTTVDWLHAVVKTYGGEPAAEIEWIRSTPVGGQGAPLIREDESLNSPP